MFRKLLLAVCLWCVSAVGSWAGEVVLRPTPCRLYDSRFTGHNTRITEATIETLNAPGVWQGGQDGCGVPPTASGVVLNLVAFDPLGPGWGRLWAYGAAEPLSTTINTTGALNEATGVMVQMGKDGKLSFHSIYSGHLIADLAGWVEPCKAQHSFDIRYSFTNSHVYVPSGSTTNLGLYGPAGQTIRLGGQASQPGEYLVVSVDPLGKYLEVSPTPQTATDQGLDVTIYPGACQPRD